MQLNHKQIMTKFNSMCIYLYTIKQDEFSNHELGYHGMPIAIMVSKYSHFLYFLCILLLQTSNQQFAPSMEHILTLNISIYLSGINNTKEDWF